MKQKQDTVNNDNKDITVSEPAVPAPYGLIYENNITNALNYLPQKIADQLVKEGRGDIEMSVSRKFIHDVQYWIVPGKIYLDGTTHQMFDYIIRRYTERVYRNATDEMIEDCREIEINLRDVARAFGKSMYGTRKMVLRTVEALSNIKIDRLDIPIREKTVKSKADIVKWVFPIISDVGKYINDKTIKNSRMRVVIHQRLADMLPKEAYLMQFPDNLFKIDTHHYPNAYLFGRRLCLWYRQNIEKNPSIAQEVKTGMLLDLALSMPEHDKIKNKGRIRQRIISPFIRDMDVLLKKRVLSSWCFIDMFTKEKINPETLNYDRFIQSKIRFELADYPKKNVQKIS